MGHGTFNFNQIYFVLITWLIEYRTESSKITAKSKKKQKTRQSSKSDISDFKIECVKNVSNEVLLAWFKFQAKIPSYSGVCIQGERQKYTPPSAQPSKVEGLRDIGHSISIGNVILGVNSVTASYLTHYNSLLQNSTDNITKCDSYFIIKCGRSLLQNATGFYYKMQQFYYKLRRYYYKIRQFLQNMTFITICDSTIQINVIFNSRFS